MCRNARRWPADGDASDAAVANCTDHARRTSAPINIVASAFNGQQRCLTNFAWINLAAAIAEIASRKLGTLEYAVDRFDVEFFRQIEHSKIFVIEIFDLLRFGCLACGQMIVELLMLRARCRSLFMATNADSCTNPG